MNEKVTIIVPIYNVKHFLPKCIESILSQTYKNIELILVNDGSKDGSGEICEKYGEQDSRIKVLHKDNGGLSDARNKGLELATGTYVSFIDGDDWVEEDMIENLLRFAKEKQVEVVMSTISSESDFKKYIDVFPWEKDRLFLGGEIKNSFLPHLISKIDPNGATIQQVSGSVCKCLYEKAFLDNHQLKFNIKVGSGQDKEFSVRVFTKCSALFTTNNCYYHYNRSTIAGGSSTQKYSSDLYDKVMYRQEQYRYTLEQEGLYDSYKISLDYIWLETILAVIDNTCYEGNENTVFSTYKQAKFVRNTSGFKDLLKNYNNKQIEKLGRTRVNLVLYSLPLYIVTKKIKIKIKKIVLTNKFTRVKNEI